MQNQKVNKNIFLKVHNLQKGQRAVVLSQLEPTLFSEQLSQSIL